MEVNDQRSLGGLVVSTWVKFIQVVLVAKWIPYKHLLQKKT